MSDIGFAEESPRGPDRRHRRRRGMLVLAVVVVALIAAAVIIGTKVFGGPPEAADYPGPGSGKVVVEVAQGDTLGEIGSTLAGKDVVASARAFRQAAVADPSSTSVQPGFYQLREKMSAAGALSLLLDPSSQVRSKVTIPEGTPADEVLQRIADGTDIPLADLQAAAMNPTSLGLPDYADGNVEGFLFPATYTFDPDVTAEQALATMVAQFTDTAKALDLKAGADKLGYSPYDVVTIASMIEKEAALPDDFGKVARVAYNRLDAGMKLQFDSTLNYALTERKGHLSLKDIQSDTPYNTYQVTGLPPTPISNPGKAALTAALNPTPGDWIYFVTINKAGKAFFTSDYQEFLKAKDKGEQARGQ